MTYEELEAENARLALKLARMEHERQESSLRRVVAAVEEQDLLLECLRVLDTYIGPAGYCRDVTSRVALDRLRAHFFKGVE